MDLFNIKLCNLINKPGSLTELVRATSQRFSARFICHRSRTPSQHLFALCSNAEASTRVKMSWTCRVWTSERVRACTYWCGRELRRWPKSRHTPTKNVEFTVENVCPVCTSTSVCIDAPYKPQKLSQATTYTFSLVHHSHPFVLSLHVYDYLYCTYSTYLHMNRLAWLAFVL